MAEIETWCSLLSSTFSSDALERATSLLISASELHATLKRKPGLESEEDLKPCISAWRSELDIPDRLFHLADLRNDLVHKARLPNSLTVGEYVLLAARADLQVRNSWDSTVAARLADVLAPGRQEFPAQDLTPISAERIAELGGSVRLHAAIVIAEGDLEQSLVMLERTCPDKALCYSEADKVAYAPVIRGKLAQTFDPVSFFNKIAFCSQSSRNWIKIETAHKLRSLLELRNRAAHEPILAISVPEAHAWCKACEEAKLESESVLQEWRRRDTIRYNIGIINSKICTWFGDARSRISPDSPATTDEDNPFPITLSHVPYGGIVALLIGEVFEVFGCVLSNLGHSQECIQSLLHSCPPQLMGPALVATTLVVTWIRFLPSADDFQAIRQAHIRGQVAEQARGPVLLEIQSCVNKALACAVTEEELIRIKRAQQDAHDELSESIGSRIRWTREEIESRNRIRKYWLTLSVGFLILTASILGILRWRAEADNLMAACEAESPHNHQSRSNTYQTPTSRARNGKR